MSGIPFGIGLLAIFQGSMLYIIDAYGPFASSAVSLHMVSAFLMPLPNPSLPHPLSPLDRPQDAHVAAVP